MKTIRRKDAEPLTETVPTPVVDKEDEIRRLLRRMSFCRRGIHTKAGHSALACFNCGGSEIDPIQWKLAEEILAILHLRAQQDTNEYRPWETEGITELEYHTELEYYKRAYLRLSAEQDTPAQDSALREAVRRECKLIIETSIDNLRALDIRLRLEAALRESQPGGEG